MKRPGTIAACFLFGTILLAPVAASGESLTLKAIEKYATPFLRQQNLDGQYIVGPHLQRHLKAEIGMALATEATKDTIYVHSARRDMDWVIANRLEPNGGLCWTGSDSPYFFVVHQHWFLIASELIRRETGKDGRIPCIQAKVWHYLLGENPACADFYLNNRAYHGPFFAYRSLDRSGVFQSQARFKGSYEIGAALWSLALHRYSSWLEGAKFKEPHDPPLPPLTVSGYLDSLALQVSRPAYALGFVDTPKKLWIRSIGWTGTGWSGWETHDWKYSLHMQEGALLYHIETGSSLLVDTERRETQNLLDNVQPTGMIHGLPDTLGTPDYEYGEALSVLGLAALAFRGTDRELSGHCLSAGERVAQHALQSYNPGCSEDGAILLAGMCRIYLAQVADSIHAGEGEISKFSE